MPRERVYVGLLRDGVWRVLLADDVTEADLVGLDMRRHFQATMTIGRDSRSARQQIKLQHSSAQNPFQALSRGDPSCDGLRLLRDRAAREAPDLFIAPDSKGEPPARH